ncbi:MAG: hypothetical protein KDE47_29730 [Caldilineaceae bacterium]|nr:hypothetical protein [Caldilineaceae bacterium]
MQDPHTITWQSATAGNYAGFTVRVAGNSESRLQFTSAPCEFACTLKQVQLAPLVVDAGAVNKRVAIGPAPRTDGPDTVELSYRDTQPLTGETPYWVRIVQVDQGMAWSSPVYVTRPEG